MEIQIIKTNGEEKSFNYDLNLNSIIEKRIEEIGNEFGFWVKNVNFENNVIVLLQKQLTTEDEYEALIKKLNAFLS